MKHTLSLVLALAIVLTLFGGVADVFAAEEAPVELHFITRGVTLSGSEDNRVKQKIEEKFNVKINWEVLPSTDYKSVSQSILASGDYPDLMEYTFSDTTELQSFIDDGILMPLNGLLEKYGPNVLADRPNAANWYFAPDGERYAISCRWSNKPETFYTIRQDWLDELKLPMPTTLDELVKVAEAFTYKDPDGNGKDDTYGFGCALEGKYYDALYIVLGAFGVTRDWMLQDGRYIPWQLTDKCKEALRYFRENIYMKGLVDPNFMVMSRNEYLENKYQDMYGIEYWYLTHCSNDSSWWTTFNNNVPWQHCVPLKPVAAEGYEAVFPRTINNGSSIGFNLLMFNDCKYPEKVMEIINYLGSDEGADLADLGVEGVNYDIVDGKYVERKLDTEAMRASGRGMYTVVFWHNIYKRNASELTLAGLESLKGFEQTAIYMPYSYDGDTSALSSLLSSMHVSMITKEDVDLDSAFEEMKQKYMSMGGKEYIEWFNEKLKELNAK